MVLVEDIMTTKENLAIVSQMTSVREALKKMKDYQTHSVVVDKTHKEGAYGLLTFKNVLQSIVAEDGDIDLLNVYDICSMPAVSVSAKLELKYAAKMMVKSSIKRLLVIDNNELFGIITMTDIITTLIESVEDI